jgi:hypothetical protein
MMYVHPGTGLWSGLPMRLFNPSEITLMTVRPAPAEGAPGAPGAPATGAGG